MAKNSVRDYDATNANNTDIQSIDISEGCSPAGINNAIREVMADLKDVSTGAVALESPSADSLTVTGDLTVDTNTLHVDSTNNRVGVGTASPSKTFHVSTGAYSYPARITSTGGTVTGLEFTNTGSGANPPVVGSKSDAIFFETNNSERMRIDSSGNVGIGTVSPETGIHAAKSNSGAMGAELTLDNPSTSAVSNATGINFLNDSGASASGVANARIRSVTNNASTGAADIQFHTWNGSAEAERMRIDSGGHLLLNTTSELSDGRLSIAEPLNTGVGISIKNNVAQGGGQTFIRFLNNSGTVAGSIQHTGTTTVAYATSSDYRLKTDVTYDWDATSRLKQLKPARFAWISDGDDAVPVDGFLAHEVQDIVPEAISGTKDAVDDEGNPVYQGIDQSKLVPLLVKTIQELEARITALEAN